MLDCVDAGLHEPQLLRVLQSYEPFFMIHHMIRSSWVNEPHISLCWGAFFHWVDMMLHNEHRVASRSFYVIDIVRLLSTTGFGSTRVDLLFPTIVFFVSLLARMSTINRLVLMIPDITLTFLLVEGPWPSSVRVFSFCSFRPPLVRADPPLLPRLQGWSASMYTISSLEDALLVVPVWFSSTINIDYKSKNESGFSLVHMAVRNDLEPVRYTS